MAQNVEIKKDFIFWAVKTYCRAWLSLYPANRRGAVNAALNSFVRPTKVDRSAKPDLIKFLVGARSIAPELFGSVDKANREKVAELHSRALAISGLLTFQRVSALTGMGEDQRLFTKLVREFVTMLLYRVVEQRLASGQTEGQILTAISAIGDTAIQQMTTLFQVE